jgi:plasmid stability protein
MQNKDEQLDVRVRAAQKQVSRERDERDLRTGRKSAERLRQENELLAPFAGSARVDLAASRSLG